MSAPCGYMTAVDFGTFVGFTLTIRVDEIILLKEQRGVAISRRNG
jgi:hypothetical protein